MREDWENCNSCVCVSRGDNPFGETRGFSRVSKDSKGIVEVGG